jgi:hypothetical protein
VKEKRPSFDESEESLISSSSEDEDNMDEGSIDEENEDWSD